MKQDGAANTTLVLGPWTKELKRAHVITVSRSALINIDRNASSVGPVGLLRGLEWPFEGPSSGALITPAFAFNPTPTLSPHSTLPCLPALSSPIFAAASS